jgi:hypothetical protein
VWEAWFEKKKKFKRSGYSPNQLNKLVLFQSYEKKKAIENGQIYIYIYIYISDHNNNRKKNLLSRSKKNKIDVV